MAAPSNLHAADQRWYLISPYPDDSLLRLPELPSELQSYLPEGPWTVAQGLIGDDSNHSYGELMTVHWEPPYGGPLLTVDNRVTWWYAEFPPQF